MPPAPSQVSTTADRPRDRVKNRPAVRHKVRLRRLALEALESRELMAVLPPAVVGGRVDLSNPGGSANLLASNETSPSVVVNPVDPSKLVAVWTRNDPANALNGGQTPIFVEGAYSTDGGANWSNLNGLNNQQLDFSRDQTNGPFFFGQVTDPTVGFDRNGKVYVSYSYHNAGNPAGRIALQKFDFQFGAPVALGGPKEVYSWTTDAALHPVVAVDSNLTTFTDPGVPGFTQSDPNSGNVYVTWGTQDALAPGQSNPNRVDMVVSVDGGQTFTQPVPINDGVNFGPAAATPSVTIGQGVGGGSALAGGKLTAVWNSLDGSIRASQVDGAASQSSFSYAGPVAITDATAGGANQPDIPATTTFAVPVSLADPNFVLRSLSVQLGIETPGANTLRVVLVPPTGSGLPPITLMGNNVDAANNGTGQGVAGGNLGRTNSGAYLGTTFDQFAARTLAGNGGGAASVGHFRALNDLSVFNGKTAAQLDGTWKVEVTDFRTNGTNNPPPANLKLLTLNFMSGLIDGPDSLVAGGGVPGAAPAAVAGSPSAPFPLKAAASPNLGIGPAPVIVSDNTLGAFSPYQGRIYVAYVAPASLAEGTPPDNTDIFLVHSEDGGRSWSSATRVNDDNATSDGFSEAGGTLGRPQFQPALAVDPATGTLVVSFRDARNDAARARVATYLATSIDGGDSFSPQVFANPTKTAIDAATGQTVNLGPFPDNASALNTAGDKTFDFGNRQGLAVVNGRVILAWAGNFNGGVQGTIKTNGATDIVVARATIAAGPRVVGSTMGPVGQPGDSLNGQRGPDGGPTAGAFIINFDRPIDPGAFTRDDVQIFFRGTTGAPAVPIIPTSVVSLDNGPFGATSFRVNFPPQSAVGTYSYLVHPTLRDRIRGVTTTTGAPGRVTQAAASPTPASPVPLPLNSTTTSTITLSGHANQTIANLALNLSVTAPHDGNLTLTLIAPNGTRVLLYRNPGDQGANFDNTGFSDLAGQSINSGSAPYRGTFRPVELLSVLNGLPVDGAYTLEIVNGSPTFAATFNAWSLDITTPASQSSAIGLGNAMDQDADAVAGEDVQAGGTGPEDVYSTPGSTGTFFYSGGFFPASFDQNTLPLIVPGPHLVSTQVANNPASGDNLVRNGVVGANADGTVNGAPAVHPGLDVTFDRDMDPTSFTAASVLRLMGPAGLINGPFTITPNPNGNDPDPNFPRTFRISFPPQDLSGTYVLTLAASIRSRAGDQMDANLNAGVDILFGAANAVGVATTPVTAVATGANVLAGTPPAPAVQAFPVTIPDARVAGGVTTPGVLTSDLVVNDDFLIQGVTAAGLGGLTVQLDITHPNDPDLTVTLLGPVQADGTRPSVVLFSNVGSAGSHANFTNTVLDDRAFQSPIGKGGPPFFGTFAPQESLLAAFGPKTVGNQTVSLHSKGTWTLQIKDGAANNPAGAGNVPQTLNAWSLTFQKPLPGSGLGEPVSDRSSASFRIFTMDPTNPLASNTWTAVGPASIGGGASGRIGGLAVDPSDPSGNTVYVGGASGGIWKTTNFLAPGGPTYVPLTDFGPTQGINIGGLAVFGRNNDPNQSIIFAATGEGDTGSAGVGFLRSLDGGATWTLLDSLDNTKAFDDPARDHTFAKNGGTTSFAISVDPKLTPTGDVIVYAALSGKNGGIWRSIDTGRTWQLMRAGQATDLKLDPNSATGAPGGNIQIIYAAFRGEGVFISPNRGQVFNLMAGGIGDPLIQDATTGNPIAVTAPASTPNGPGGRIALAKPELTGNPTADLIYQGWLYAVVVNPDGSVRGLYMTKDFGQNWAKIHISNPAPVVTDGKPVVSAIPTNDYTKPDYDVGGPPAGTGLGKQGNYDISLGIDPTNPNVVYLGGMKSGQPSGFLRIDATTVNDAHSLVSHSQGQPDRGLLSPATSGPVVAKPTDGEATFNGRSYLNFIRNPSNPFDDNATLKVNKAGNFTNTGADVRWIPFDIGGTDQHRIVVVKDPLTGNARVIIGDDQGVFSAVDDNGTFDSGIGTAGLRAGSYNGNLQITQFYYGAAQPSNLAAQIAGALFYGSAQDNGGPSSDPNVLDDGNISWGGPGGDATGVATDQQGKGTLYQYWWPCCGGNGTSFFQVDGTGRTFGLLQKADPGPTPDPQWPQTGGSNFAVNPLDGNQILISSQAGRIFSTETQGRLWLVVGEPTTGKLDGTYAPALAYGAPDPSAPGGIGNLGSFIYVGTSGGRIYVSRVGGGANGNEYTDISAGLDGSSVGQIVTNPTRGSHEAYAVTLGGVYRMVDSTAPGATWVNITGNLNSVIHNIFGSTSQQEVLNRGLDTIQADYRYVIPDNFANPNGPTHPLLYVGGAGGVFRSLDNGATWTLFPDTGAGSLNNSPVQGGNLPVAQTTSLSLVLGDVNPTTGRPNVANGPNLLLASTYGRGSFGIRLAPLVFPNTATQSNLLTLDPASDTGLSNSDKISNNPTPTVRGLSEQTAFGNSVTVQLLDLTPLTPGGPNRDPRGAPVIGSAQTDASGRFIVTVTVPFTTPGVKILGVQAINASGTRGNVATLSYTFLNTPPATPGRPTLEAASDTGSSQTDGYTADTSPTFDVANFTPSTASSPIVTQLLRKARGAADSTYVVVGQVTNPLATAQATFVSITDTGGVAPPALVADGLYDYAARQLDLAGNVSVNPSASTAVTIDTVAPNRPSDPTLLPADDSGVLGDKKTRVVRPHLTGTLAPTTPAPGTPAEPPASVQIVRVVGATTTVLGTATVLPDNTYSVAFDADLPQGVTTVQMRSVDRAGNLGPLSGPYSLTVITKAPAVPTLTILPADDTEVGASNTIPNGAITRINRPHMIGTATPGLTIDLVFASAPDTPLASVPVPLNGSVSSSYQVQFPAALTPDGDYVVQARARDEVGNTSLSTPFTLRILTQGPTRPPTLALATASQYGSDAGSAAAGLFTTASRRPTMVGRADPGPNVFVDLKTDDGTVVATSKVAADGSYAAQLSFDLSDGSIRLTASSRDIAGNPGPVGASMVLTIVSVDGDYDGSGKAALATFRPTNAQASILFGGGGGQIIQFGAPNLDIPLQADFDGDGKADVATYRPSDATWSILQSRDGGRLEQFGEAASVPLPGNYDGPGKAELAVYNPTSGMWSIVSNATGRAYSIGFGVANLDVPAPADYNGDGRTDLAVYRPTTGEFFVLDTLTNTISTFTVPGGAGGIPVPADYTGDGKADYAVFQPSTATWTVIDSKTGVSSVTQFGAANLDIPIPRDYDGDGKADLAIYRPTTSTFAVVRSSLGGMVLAFGAPNLDLPLAGPPASRNPARASAGQSLSTSVLPPAPAALRVASSSPVVNLDFGRTASALAASASAPATAITPAAVTTTTKAVATPAVAPALTPRRAAQIRQGLALQQRQQRRAELHDAALAALAARRRPH